MDATILIPTYRHPRLLAFSIRSALAQRGVECEVLVLGDGVEDDTREVVSRFPVRFFDFPKGERNGERHRHYVLQQARGRIVCYLGDDDLLLPDHCAEMLGLLAAADFAHSYPVFVREDGSLSPGLVDLSRPECRQQLLDGECQVSLTGVAHTLEAYRRLPYGWRPAPADVWSDLYMWQQFVALPGFRGVTSWHCTHLKISANARPHMSDDERVRELEHWWEKAQDPAFSTVLQRWVKRYRRQAVRYDFSRPAVSSRRGSRQSRARS